MADFDQIFADIGRTQNQFSDVFANLGEPTARITVRPPPSAAALDIWEAGKQQVRSGLEGVSEGLSQIANAPGGRDLAAAISGIQQGKDIGQAVEEAQPRSARLPIPDRLKAVGDILGGIGKAAGGAVEYATAGAMAPYRAYVSQPLANVFGIPREYTEFAATSAMPIPRLPPRVPRAAAPTVAELKTEATRLYQSPEVTQTAFKPQVRTDLAAEIADDFDRLRVSDRAAKPVNQIVGEFAAKAEKQGGIASAEDIDALRKHLGEIEPVKDATGKITNLPELRAVQIARERIDEFLPAIPQEQHLTGSAKQAADALEEARGNVRAREAAELINRKQFRAEGRAAVANSGMNIANTMRSRIFDILDNPILRRGYSQGELGMMHDIAFGTPSENTIRRVSNILGGGGGLGALHSGGVGGILGSLVAGPAGAAAGAVAAPLAGYALKHLSNVMTTRNIERLNEVVRANSPLGRRISAQLQDWSAVAQSAEAKPLPGNIARLTLASRNLSNNLADAGIEIAPESLLGSFVPGANRQPSEQ